MQEIKEHIYSLEKKYGRNVEARRAFNSALRGGGFKFLANLFDKINYDENKDWTEYKGETNAEGQPHGTGKMIY